MAPVDRKRTTAGTGRGRERGMPWRAVAVGHHGRGRNAGYPTSLRWIGSPCGASTMPVAAPRNHHPAGAIPGRHWTVMSPAPRGGQTGQTDPSSLRNYIMLNYCLHAGAALSVCVDGRGAELALLPRT